MKFTVADALMELLPNVEWKLTDNDLSTLEILSEGNFAIPTNEEINKTIKKLESDLEIAEREIMAKRKALLEKLGITEEEAKLLLS